MLPNPIEGPWEKVREEIQAHDAELRGHLVKLIITDEKPIMLDKLCAPLLEEAENLKREKPQSLTARKEAFGEEIAEKYREQGFNL